MITVRLHLSALILAMAMVPSASAQVPSKAPALLSAEQMIHDQERNLVTAAGAVEVSQGGRVLQADKVTYNLNTDRIFANGNVSLTEPTGEVIFADEIEVTGDLKNALAQDIRVLLTDQARIAAAVGHRTSGTVTELERAVYSPCLPCREDPERAPLWQVKALHVVHDKETQDIEYEDAWLEMFGIPVAYTPYLTHPDPTVERRSGLLAPSFGQSENLGTTLSVPYYYVISPHQDLTLTPTITTSEGPVLDVEHRRRFTFGEMKTNGSITRDSEGETRGHLFADGRFDLNDTWRTGYRIRRTTDDTYLRTYGHELTSKPYLNSRAWAEAFTPRSYGLIEGFAFQNQYPGVDNGELPVVAPLLQYNYVGTPDARGGRWNVDAIAAALTRSDGEDSQRLSIRPYWSLPYNSPLGDVYTLTLGAYVAGAHASDVTNGTDTSSGHIVPEASLEWRFPLARTDGSISQVIEPIVMGVVSPTWDDDNFPNEDSLDIEFTEENLFTTNRYTGFDRLETGPRVSYGLKYDVYGASTGHFGALVGQSYRMESDDDIPDAAGFEDNFSDIVGRFVASPSDVFDLYYRFRLDKDNFEFRRNEVIAAAGVPALRTSINYTSIDESASAGEDEDRSEVGITLSSAISQYWHVSTFLRRDLERDKLVNSGITGIYDDECFTFALSYVNSGTSDRDLDAGQTIMARVVFKTLGELPLNLY